MKTKYKFLPHTADVMFEAYGNTIEELFENAALALECSMVNIHKLEDSEHYDITLESDDLEKLLYDFLSELIFVKDTDGLLFGKFDVVIGHKNKNYRLFAKCTGEHLDYGKHELLDDVKAVTMHDFILEKKTDNTWFCRIIIDV